MNSLLNLISKWVIIIPIMRIREDMQLVLLLVSSSINDKIGIIVIIVLVTWVHISMLKLQSNLIAE